MTTPNKPPIFCMTVFYPGGKTVAGLIALCLRTLETDFPDAFPEWGEYAFEHGSLAVIGGMDDGVKAIATLKLRTIYTEEAHDVAFLATLSYPNPLIADTWDVQLKLLSSNQLEEEIGRLSSRGSYQNYYTFR